MNSTKLKPEGAKALGGGLKSNKTLMKSNLFENDIGLEAARAIGEILEVNSTLISLVISFTCTEAKRQELVNEILRVEKALKTLQYFEKTT